MIPYLPYQRKPFLNFCLEFFHFPILLVPFGREKRPNTEIQPDGGCKMRETDLADELFGQPGKTALPAGVRVATARQGGVTITRVEIAREGLARPRGRYVTLEVPSVSLLDERDSAVIEAAAAELRPLLPPRRSPSPLPPTRALSLTFRPVHCASRLLTAFRSHSSTMPRSAPPS